MRAPRGTSAGWSDCRSCRSPLTDSSRASKFARTYLPQGASGFTTLELKTNFLGTTREGAIFCRATPAHLGRTTQVSDAMVTIEGTDRKIALLRCTQMVLWPK